MPSNPLFWSVHPAIWTRLEREAGKQAGPVGDAAFSSPSVGSLSPSVLPAGHAVPKVVDGIGVAPVQNWKCPISELKPMLYVWAAQITRVCSDEVLYMGWKS